MPALVASGLTSIDVRNNQIAGVGATQLSAAVLGNTRIEKFNAIPVKEMRADSFTELDLHKEDIGVEGAMVVAGLMPVSSSLTVTDMRFNQLDAESATMLAAVAKERGISLCGITPDQTEANLTGEVGKRMMPADAILLTADIFVRGVLTRVSAWLELHPTGLT